jgi:hypothetical protein
VALAIQNPVSMEKIDGRLKTTIILGDFPAMFDLEIWDFNHFQSRLIRDCPAMLDQRVTSWLDTSTPISEGLSLFVFFGLLVC